MIPFLCYFAVSLLVCWSAYRFIDAMPDDAFQVWYFSAFWPLIIVFLAIGGVAQLIHLAHDRLTRQPWPRDK